MEHVTRQPTTPRSIKNENIYIYRERSRDDRLKFTVSIFFNSVYVSQKVEEKCN